MPDYNDLSVKSFPAAFENFHPVPSWLNRNFIENALRISQSDQSINLIELDIIPAISKGENYASVMFRIRAKYQKRVVTAVHVKSDSFIVKTSFEGDKFAENLFAQYDVYHREMQIYEKILPKLKSILQKAGDSAELFADAVKVDYQLNAMIFEDLSTRSFVMAERKNGLDFTHACMVLNRLAKMQAASAVLNEKNPEIFESYDRGMFNRHTNAFAPFFEDSLEACARAVNQWKGYESYSDKLLKLIPNVMEYGKRVFDARLNRFNCFVHGDLWINNVMFKYDDGMPQDMMLIDFQFSCWGSPAIDLHYFLNTSLKEELRERYQEELVHYYYLNLVENLKKFEFKGQIPRLHDFWIEIMEKSFYAFTSACIVQPVMLNENIENADFAALMGRDERAKEFKSILYRNEKVIKNLQRLLPVFDRRGLLDVA